MNAIRKIRIKWQVWCGKAVDIWSKSPYPADVLSNLHDNGFCLWQHGGILAIPEAKRCRETTSSLQNDW